MIQKKKATWHKSKTGSGKTVAEHKKQIRKTDKKVDEAKHWVVSQAKLMKILEAAGMSHEKPVTMLPRSRDR